MRETNSAVMEASCCEHMVYTRNVFNQKYFSFFAPSVVRLRHAAELLWVKRMRLHRTCRARDSLGAVHSTATCRRLVPGVLECFVIDDLQSTTITCLASICARSDGDGHGFAYEKRLVLHLLAPLAKIASTRSAGRQSALDALGEQGSPPPKSSSGRTR